MTKSTTDAGWVRLETLLDVFRVEERIREAGIGKGWMTKACDNIRSIAWYASIRVSELERVLAALPWWYTSLTSDKPKKEVTESQRAVRLANMAKARHAKATYAAPYRPDKDTALCLTPS